MPGHEYRERIEPAAAGRSLLDHLAERYTHSTRTEWLERIEAGRVLIDGRAGRPDEPLRAGATVAWRRPPWPEPDAPTDLAVLFRDEHVLAVAKPAGLPTLPGAGFVRNTVATLVASLAPGAAPAHRLGRFTSGIVLCGISAVARRGLAAEFAARRVRKCYRALAAGTPTRDAFAIDTPIGPVPHAVLGTVHGATPDGKPAHSEVVVLERRAGSFLCDVEITTGRPHQIRVHLAAAGHPLLGDPLYAAGGRPAPDRVALPGDPGYRLHARRIEVRHPVADRTLCLDCPPPPELVPGGGARME